MTRAERCVELGHPGDTFNPWLRKTWCHCGETVAEGDTAVLPKWWSLCPRAHVIIDGVRQCLGEDLEGVRCRDAD